MSDSAGDIDDELLALAGATDKKRRRRQSPSKPSSSKRRKADTPMDTDPEDGPESEEDQSAAYPLEGKYIDESDRERLMQMSEIDREATLAQRLEEMQRIQDKRNLDQMLKHQSSRGTDQDSVSKAAKRQHTIRGATKEKSRKLDELKAKRKAKGEKRKKKDSPKRDRSSSPMDVETSTGEEEDGQITKLEEEEEKGRKLFGKTSPDDEPATLEDLNKCRLSRDMIAKHCMAPWFNEYAKGAWVRFLIGNEQGLPIYRICEISNITDSQGKTYKVNDQTVNQLFELKHGTSTKAFAMDKVSNSSFQPKEFDRLAKVFASENVKLPSKRQLEKKAAQMSKLHEQPMTEDDINAMLARKSLIQSKVPQGHVTMERSRLTQARKLAERRLEYSEAERIARELEQLASAVKDSNAQNEMDMLAKVNQRNRKANEDTVRKSELLMAERKRKARLLAVTGSPGSDSPAPQDPSVRLKTIPRTFTPSRPGTPNPVTTPPSSAKRVATAPVSSCSPSSLSRLASLDQCQSFEAAVVDAIEVDLGDF